MMRTEYGLRYQLMTEVCSSWSAYDRIVAGTHLKNFGHIIVDARYGTPIDNEHDLFVIEGIVRAVGSKGGN